MASTQGGAIQGVKVLTAADLEENGGAYVLATRQAIPARGFNTLTRAVKGGFSLPVYIVTDADIQSGNFRLRHGTADMPVCDVDALALTRTVRGRGAIPIYVRNSDEWPSVAVANRFYDTFTGTNGTLISKPSHTPDIDTVGGGWLFNGSAEWDIQGNEANCTTGGIAYADAGLSDCTIIANVSVASNASNSRIIFRFLDTDNYWTIFFRPLGTRINITENVSGTDTIRNTQFTGVWPNPANIQIAITLSDETISYETAGDIVESGSYALASNFKTETNHGILSAAGAMTVDDFDVQGL